MGRCREFFWWSHQFIGIDIGIFADLFHYLWVQDFPGMIRYSYPDTRIVFKNFMTPALTYTGESLSFQESNDLVCRDPREFFTHTETSTVVKLISCAWGIFSPDSM